MVMLVPDSKESCWSTVRGNVCWADMLSFSTKWHTPSTHFSDSVLLMDMDASVAFCARAVVVTPAKAAKLAKVKARREFFIGIAPVNNLHGFRSRGEKRERKRKVVRERDLTQKQGERINHKEHTEHIEKHIKE